jgi:CheY-like chemotaxis protein
MEPFLRLQNRDVMEKETVGVLMADDSEDDRLFLRIILKGNPRLALVGEVSDGEEAIAYLSGAGQFADRERFPYPDVMFLDLKMPRRTGFEVLGWLRTQSFEKPVVIVVSGSLLPEDAPKSLALGAAAYHRKVMLKQERDALFREIEESLAARGNGRSAAQSAS